MAVRRVSARTSGGSDKVNSTSAGQWASQMDVQTRKRIGEDGLASEGKRRKSVKKQSYKAPTMPLPNSSDTPPEDDPTIDLPPPPPPSERKIARRRLSVRAAARAFTPDADSPSTTKRQKTAGSATNTAAHRTKASSSKDAGAEETLRSDLTASTSTNPRKLDFFASNSMSTRPAMPRPLSPPPALGASISRRKSSMGPPIEPFVRKTRKSMSRLGILPADMSDDTEVPLAESETPMIRKNRQLREEQSRRSSLGMRGQRASSSLGRGEISIPHPTVDSSQFHKHISPILPEPIRCRHLLVFCAKRATDDHLAEGKSKGKSREKGKSRYQGERTEQGDQLVKDIMDSFMAGLGKGDVDTNVFSSGGGLTTSGLSLRPHPQNVINREQKAKAESVIKRCQNEKTNWRSIKTRTKKRQEEIVGALRVKASETAEIPDLSGMEPWMTSALELADEILGEGLGELEGKGEFADVEFKVDMLHQSTHSAQQYSLQATRFLDGIFSTLASDLRTRDPTRPGRSTDTDGPDPATLLAAATTSSRTAAAASSNKPRSDPINMLRALAAAEHKQQTEEDVAAARSVQPVSVASMALGVSTTGTGIGPAQTPRRSAPTPRRAGELGGSTAGPQAPGTGQPGTGGVRGRMYGRGAQAAAE